MTKKTKVTKQTKKITRNTQKAPKKTQKNPTKNQSLQEKKHNKDSYLNGVCEKEFLEALENITKRLAIKFKFGYHEIDDMKQQAAIFAIEGLQNYDKGRPLENFLWTHVRNRLFNYKRNNYQRPDKPCQSCEFFDKHYAKSDNQCTQHKDKLNCELYASWFNRNDAKKNIMQPQYISENQNITSSLTKDSFLQNLENKEIIGFLDDNVESQFREAYLKLKHGAKVPKSEVVKLQKYIESLIENFKCLNQKSLKKEAN